MNGIMEADGNCCGRVTMFDFAIKAKVGVALLRSFERGLFGRGWMICGKRYGRMKTVAN